MAQAGARLHRRPGRPRARVLAAVLGAVGLPLGAEAVFLRSTASSAAKAQAKAKAKAKSNLPHHKWLTESAWFFGKKPSWFGEFDQGESTYTADGIPDPDSVDYGFAEGSRNPIGHRRQHSSKWFDEAPSGGFESAWQTQPSPPGGGQGDWRNTGEGWKQDYARSPYQNSYLGYFFHPRRVVEGRWFDSSVGNYDKYGRRTQPGKHSPPARFREDGAGYTWLERSRNATFGCAQAGCTANVSLIAFNTTTEVATNCKLSIHVRPTDYDDEFSREYTKDWLVNGYLVSRRCDPMMKGCNQTLTKPFHSCVMEYPIDHLISQNGTLLIQGSINTMVDECPHDGNLLSGLASVTCLVHAKWSFPGSSPGMLTSNAAEVDGGNFSDNWQGEFGSESWWRRHNCTEGSPCFDYGTEGQYHPGGVYGGNGTYTPSSAGGWGYGPGAAWVPYYGAGGSYDPYGPVGPDGTRSVVTSGQPWWLGRHAPTDGQPLDASDGDFVTTAGGVRYVERSEEAAVEFSCKDPGCTGMNVLRISPRVALDGGQCFGNITLAQTDFDQHVDVESNLAMEEVEFINIGGIGDIAMHVRPGRNPCIGAMRGEPVKRSEMNFTIVQNLNLTQHIIDLSQEQGTRQVAMQISGKISDLVDECAREGDLLKGMLSVRCCCTRWRVNADDQFNDYGLYGSGTYVPGR